MSTYRRRSSKPDAAGDRFRRRCAALLEVVIALSILLVAMAVVGLVFRNGQRNVELTELMTRGQMMTERLLAEMDTGILKMDEQEQSGFFGEEGVPGMAWRVVMTPHEKIKGLLDIDIEIFMGDPDGSEEERQVVLSTRVQRPEPRGIDFEKDFGLDEDQISQLTDAIPGGAAVLDPTNFDPRQLASLDLDTLMELLPTLMQAFGTSFGGGQMEGLLQAAQSGDLSALESLGQQAAGQVGGSGGGRSSQGAGAQSGGRQPSAGAKPGGGQP